MAAVSENTPDPKASESESSDLYAMDTVMSLTAYGSHAKEALDAASAEIQRLDKLFSISSETGDIYQVNKNGEGDLSEDTRSLLASALEYGRETDGIFDCTIEPVMEAWGFTTQNYSCSVRCRTQRTSLSCRCLNRNTDRKSCDTSFRCQT